MTSGASLPKTGAWWTGTSGDFVGSSTASIVASLSSAAGSRGLSITREQHAAWERSVDVLREALASINSMNASAETWGVVMEFELPRRATRPDAVVLAGSLIVPIEFKVGATAFDRSSRMQVEEYAHDLRDFHEPSHEAPIVPVLVSTEASFDDVDLNALPLTSRAQCAGSSSLATLLLRLVELHGRERQIDVAVWSVGRYRPTPGILEAARDVYAGHEVRALSASYADNLDLTVDSLREAVQEARRESIRRVCFVTGVPGSGKTLAGLNAVHHHLDGLDGQALGAYLSGNGPLVEVLRYAIATDLQRRQGVAAAEARRLAATFVQPVHRFVQELANGVHPPPEHVAVFDEAQRAWDERQMEKKQGVAASEAATMLDIMERAPDWSVIIALVGEGQEINTGEAGLIAWLDALQARPQWRVSASSRVAEMADGIGIQIDESLDLGVSVRSPRAKAVSEWADALTAGDLPRARDLAPLISEYPMLLTRDLASCREYLRDRARPDRRVGLLASAQARRLRAFGIEMDSSFQGGVDWPRWFVDSEGDVRSSYALEVAASEFKCQGLEIEWAGLCWGDDFTWQASESAWRARKFIGSRWTADRDRHHAINRYRVLLTRARYGLVLWIPKPGPRVPQVDCDAFDSTFEALQRAGCASL